MAGTIFSKFYWSDWLSDPGIRASSYAARGLWMDMLCIAASADPIGYLVVNGRPLDVSDIARLTGGQIHEVEALLAELERNGVFSRDRSKRIYSRRMIKDVKRSAEAKKNGKTGGNPTLLEQSRKSGEVNPPLKLPDKPQEPEARSQEPPDKTTSAAPVARRAARTKVELDALEDRLRRAAKTDNDPSPGLMDLSPILGLLDAGYSESEDILPTIATKVAKGARPRSWSFFTEAIRDARQRRLGIAAVQAPSAPREAQIDWDRWARGRADGGAWPMALGPEPGFAGCRCPPEILKQHGIDPETGAVRKTEPA